MERDPRCETGREREPGGTGREREPQSGTGTCWEPGGGTGTSRSPRVEPGRVGTLRVELGRAGSPSLELGRAGSSSLELGRAGSHGEDDPGMEESPLGATRCVPGAERGTGTPREEEEEEEEEEEDDEDVAGDTEDIPLLAGAAPRQQRRQQRSASEDEDGWEATPSVATVAAASADARSPDLFERLQHAVSSLERAVFSRHRQPPPRPPPAPGWHRALQSLQELSRTPGWARRWWPEVAAGPGLPVEVAAAAARNASLRAALDQRDEELGTATAALRALRGERERLQGKVRDLREALARLEELGGSGSDTPGVGGTSGTGDISGNGDTPGTGDTPGVGDTPGTGDTPGPSSPPGHRPRAPLSPQPSAGPGREQEERLQQLQGVLARLQEANRELLAALGECKDEAERLSLELGRREARCSGLRLALRCSERCGGAYAALLDLVRAKVAPEGGTRGAALPAPSPGTGAEPSPGREPGPGPATPEPSPGRAPGPGPATPEPPGPAEPDSREDSADSPRGMEEGALRERIRRLRAEQAAVEGSLLDAPEPSEPPRERDPRGRAERALREARALLPGWRRPDKEELLQELAVLKEALAELRTRLQLAQKEKRALELLLTAHGPREAALRLLLRERERERHRDREPERDGRDGASGSSGSSSGSSSEEEARMGRGAAMAPGNPPDPRRTREELLRIRARTEQLRGRARELALALERGSAASRAQQGHSASVTLELLQAHSSLALAYRGARRKQAEQLRRLRARAAALRGQHGRRERALARTLRELQRGGETCI
ncbi:Usher syndrome type-1C protein-binding protein 1 isoform X3 [Pyrgilauda ruficollis]|uniref:Usher syndrome type-1C protein-binding protein 1 isoform X3 n=1 Tax=Pyrgilauda ruficollis TaxID=221976 RepID=UPI001B874377|nr:Usher syndrome type-1C protein-binding protein 1 isoform X3 [Pyrgilauda ruficollis]